MPFHTFLHAMDRPFVTLFVCLLLFRLSVILLIWLIGCVVGCRFVVSSLTVRSLACLVDWLFVMLFACISGVLILALCWRTSCPRCGRVPRCSFD